MNKYTRLFIDESRVYLPDIATILERLEAGRPEKLDMREGQRLAHSIKGMALFEQQQPIALLSAAMERAFERMGAEGTDVVLVRVLADAVPLLSEMIDQVEQAGAPDIDPGSAVAAIEASL